jgi:glycosyltransferase involved in cell wall biosynthesis
LSYLDEPSLACPPCPRLAGEARGEGDRNPLTILQIAYPFSPVSPDAVGGAEQILSALDHALTRAGHRSFVIADERSIVTGTLLAIPAFTGVSIEPADRTRAHAAIRATTRAALNRHPIDLIHLHGIDFPAYLPLPGLPVLITAHLPPSWHAPDALSPTRPGTFLHAVSTAADTALRGIAGHPNILPPVPNGVPTHAFGRASHARRSFALCFGRICPEKAQHLAIDAAARAGIPLLLAGQVFPYAAHQSYFETEIRPRLRPPHRWLGPASFARKRRLLAAARCVLVPSLAPETSGLVAMEAAASGTPVIAFPAGALADTVRHGITGFLVNDTAEMAATIRRTDDIDPETCRRVARQRFSLAVMTNAYLARYRELSHVAVPA